MGILAKSQAVGAMPLRFATARVLVRRRVNET
jgi:hypothetical protein